MRVRLPQDTGHVKPGYESASRRRRDRGGTSNTHVGRVSRYAPCLPIVWQDTTPLPEIAQQLLYVYTSVVVFSVADVVVVVDADFVRDKVFPPKDEKPRDSPNNLRVCPPFTFCEGLKAERFKVDGDKVILVEKRKRKAGTTALTRTQTEVQHVT
ncbi:hypothetical protein ElyMa_002932200 [Elysia marginata]|uniref:Uncharacterized protein n=1 Tax=Elysia marginata TaxID=1093978 RepID=A0AAV4I4B2_9GAST|nr:hypothetical protein ElyMa_002932200 [Elysia marginata]